MESGASLASGSKHVWLSAPGDRSLGRGIRVRSVGAVVAEISDRPEEIFSRLSDDRDAILYLFIQQRFKSHDPRDAIFQFAFEKYYGLDDAKLTAAFRKSYFDLFYNQSRRRDLSVKRIAERLGRDSNVVHFSFASKMVATIDTASPIYDANVAKLFAFNADRGGLRFDQQLERLDTFYAHLRCAMAQALQCEVIRALLGRLRKNVTGWSQISPMKQLDFVFWTTGKLLIEERSNDSKSG